MEVDGILSPEQVTACATLKSPLDAIRTLEDASTTCGVHCGDESGTQDGHQPPFFG